MAPLTDRVFVVTGAGGALAGSIVRSFAHAGARLVLVDRHEEHVAERAREHHATRARPPTLRRSTAPSPWPTPSSGATAASTASCTPSAASPSGASSTATPPPTTACSTLNVRTLFNVLRAVAPGMLTRGDGFICGISSEPGWTGHAPGTALYGAAKAAATSLLRTLELEARGTQVGVCIVYPMGAIDTPANRKDMPNVDPKSFIDPDEIAASILHAATRGARGPLERASHSSAAPSMIHDAAMRSLAVVLLADAVAHAQQPQPTPTPATPQAPPCRRRPRAASAPARSRAPSRASRRRVERHELRSARRREEASRRPTTPAEKERIAKLERKVHLRRAAPQVAPGARLRHAGGAGRHRRHRHAQLLRQIHGQRHRHRPLQRPAHEGLGIGTASLFGVTGILALAAPNPYPKPLKLDAALMHKLSMLMATACFAAQIIMGPIMAVSDGKLFQKDMALAHLVIGYGAFAFMGVGHVGVRILR